MHPVAEAFAYDPSGHSKHPFSAEVPGTGENEPLLHGVQPVAAMGEKKPGVHLSQTRDPRMSEYEPPSHGKQTTCPGAEVW